MEHKKPDLDHFLAWKAVSSPALMMSMTYTIEDLPPEEEEE